ncbi:MAG: 3-phosphoshikimate 1-carboxyvinyltransferase [Gammaproteobacteria bacterium]|nr:3-phosphoshikimate 1-carboxyvinyltransferase [Gammaproteobacteria bacterium]
MMVKSDDKKAGPGPEASYLVEPAGQFGGEISVPGDKSISHRSLMLGAIAEGVTEIDGLLASQDCIATAEAIRDMGVRVIAPKAEGDCWHVHGVGLRGLKRPAEALDLGNSGTSMRLLTGLLCAQGFSSTLVGDESLMKRPMERVALPLRKMGARITTCDGRPPVRIDRNQGLNGIDYQAPVASAQVKSAILLAGLYARGVTRVTEPGISRDHTERMLASFGVVVRRKGLSVEIEAPASLLAGRISVPGDLSSAAFFMVGACLASDRGVTIRNIGVNPTRTGVIDILRKMGAKIDLAMLPTRKGGEPVADIRVAKSHLHGIDIVAADVALAIDEFPILMVAAACAEGVTRVSGAEELRVKESDRIRTVVDGLRALGAKVEEKADGMVVTGGALKGGEVNSQGDHRIAMAFAIASLMAGDAVTILNTSNVATSFPGFVDHAARLGMKIVENRGE